MSATHPGQGQRFVSTAAAALRSGFHRDYLRKLRRTGGGPPYSRVGRAVRYDVDEFDAWMRARTFSSQAEELARGEHSGRPTP